MKIAITKKTVGKGEKAFTTYQTTICNTPARIAKSMLEVMKAKKPEQIDGTTATYDFDESSLLLTAQVKNGFTNLYLTVRKPKDEAEETDDLPF